MDPRRIAEIVQALADGNTAGVSTEDITAALAWIKQQGPELATAEPTTESVQALSTLVNQRRALLAEQARRAAEPDLAAQHAEALAELDGKHDPSRDHIQPDPEAAKIPQPEDSPETEPADESNAEPEEKSSRKGTSRKSGGSDGGSTTQRSRQLGDLSGDIERPEGSSGVIVTRTAIQGNVPGHTTGQQLATDEQLARAFVDKARALNSPSAAGRHDVVRIEFNYPAERVIGATDNEATLAEKFRAATDPEVITAAGGLCLPLAVRYDIETIGVTDRPVRDSLVGFQAERGGLQYRAPFDALAMTEGLGLWTQEMDEAIVVPPPDPDTNVYKTCFVVDCPGLLEASIYSTYLCLEFANMSARFDPEWVRATNEAARVAWARFAENQLLARMAAGSKAINGIHQLGAVRDILLNLDRIIAYYRHRHRLNTRVPLHMWLPQYVIQMLMSDLAMQMSNGSPAEMFAIAQAQLENWFGTRGVNVTWHLDGLAGGTQNTVVFPSQVYADLAAGGTVPPYPTSIDSILAREGDWMFLDGGTLDLGLVRDSQLNMRNRYQTFIESFEGVAFTGVESLRIRLPLVPSGASSGTIDPRAIDPTLPAAA